jgi:hypothetical protein
VSKLTEDRILSYKEPDWKDHCVRNQLNWEWYESFSSIRQEGNIDWWSYWSEGNIPQDIRVALALEMWLNWRNYSLIQEEKERSLNLGIKR